MTPKHLFKSGKYYVGDPCYAVADKNWDNLIETTGCFGLELDPKPSNWDYGKFQYNGWDCFADGTAYGDGVYYSNHGDEFGVDAGLIGIIPAEVVDGDYTEGGAFLEFDKDFLAWADDGVFHFGDIVIDTKNEDEEEEEYWGDEDEDEEEDYEDEEE